MPAIAPPPEALYAPLVAEALAEDLGHGDLTTAATVSPEASGLAVIRAKEEAVVAGAFVAAEAFRQIDPDLDIETLAKEGDLIAPGDTLMRIRGQLAAILQAERVALNFLQRLCGVATLTRAFVEAVGELPCKVVDTRKTTPGLRLLQKYAVRIGGGFNHRFGLSDGILIKDNHIAACGSVAEAVRRARKSVPHCLLVEVEVSDTDQLAEAIEAGAQAILLDNMDPAGLAEAVAMARRLAPGVLLEASGGVRLDTVRAMAETGVDLVSVGALTHSAKAVDLSLKIR